MPDPLDRSTEDVFGDRPSHIAYLAGPGAHRVIVSGDVDIALRQGFDDVVERFVASDATDVDVDLSSVTFLDSTGLSFLVLLRNACLERQGAVTLVAPSEVAMRTLELAAFDHLFPIVDLPAAP